MPSHLKRYQSEGTDHFITFSCYRRLPYLNEAAARIVFEEILERLRQRHQFYIFGYVLMPEHVHLLLSEPRRHPLATTLTVLTHRKPSPSAQDTIQNPSESVTPPQRTPA